MFTLDLSFSGASLESSSIVLLSLASQSFPIKSWRLSQRPGWIVIKIIDCNWWTNFLAGRKYAGRGNSFTSGAQWWEFFFPSCQTSLPLYITYTPIMLCLMKCRIFCTQSALIDLGRFKCFCKGKDSDSNSNSKQLWCRNIVTHFGNCPKKLKHILLKDDRYCYIKIPLLKGFHRIPILKSSLSCTFTGTLGGSGEDWQAGKIQVLIAELSSQQPLLCKWKVCF